MTPKSKAKLIHAFKFMRVKKRRVKMQEKQPDGVIATIILTNKK